MAGKNMHVDIILGAKTDGFAGAMAEVNKLGEALSGISKAAQDLLKESAETYKGYEDNMLTVRAVLNSSKDSATGLANQMKNLDEAAQKWAASTIFNTTDVSKALVDAARAGWSYDQMMEGIPSVMNMAQAAGMTLAESMEYFVPVMNATGTSFEEGSLLIDKWVQSANNAPTTVSEIGEAITNMGAISRMFASDNELFTMLDMLALNGVTGNNAGTALRNVISRLYAPTKVAKDAMEELGLSIEDVLDEGESLTSAEEALAEYGLSAYDASGNMRPLLDVFQDISKLMTGKSEQEVNKFLKTVFGTKQYANAYTLLKSIQSGYEGIYTSIETAAGTAEQAGDIMTSGLTGAMTRLSSKWEEFELQIGEKFAPSIEGAAEMLGGLVDTLNGMDDAQLAALTGGLTAVAGLAPTLLATGGAVKLVETIGVQGTAILVTVAAIGSLVGYISEMNDMYKDGIFGSVELDSNTINKYLDNQATIYSLVSGLMEDGAAAVQASAENVEGITQTLNEKMFTYVIGGAKLSQSQIDDLKSLGESLSTEVQNGIKGAQVSSNAFFNSIFGEYSTEGALVSGWFDSLSAEASQIGLELRNQMVSALEDGSLNGEEKAAINATIQRLAAIEAQIQSAMAEADYNAAIFRAGNVSYDSASAFMSEQDAKYKQEMLDMENLYAQEYGYLMASWDYYASNPDEKFWYKGEQTSMADLAAAGVTKESISADMQAALDSMRASTKAKYSDIYAAMFQSLLDGAGSPEAIAEIANMMDMYGADVYQRDDIQASMQQAYDRVLSAMINSYMNGGNVSWDNDPLLSYVNGLIPGIGDELNRQVTEYANATSSDMAPFLMAWASMHPEAWSGIWGSFTPQTAGYASQNDVEGNTISPIDEIYNAAIQNMDTRSFGEIIAESIIGDITAGDFEQFKKDLQEFYEWNGGEGPMDEGTVANLYAQGVEGFNQYKAGFQSGGSIPVNITPSSTVDAYANGGRATTASIFGEAGAEWAIPEEHSDRTAELLNAAREASGFTWGDLISRNGGLNAGGGGDITVNYSPTVNANDASDVENVLARDKKNLKRMLEGLLENYGMSSNVGAFV